MTSDNCRKEKEIEACINEQGQYLLPFMTSAMDVAVIDENPSHDNRILTSYRPTIESLVRDWNIHEALKAVKCNKGASGIDGMEVEKLEKFLVEEWPKNKAGDLKGTLPPQGSQKVRNPKTRW